MAPLKPSLLLSLLARAVAAAAAGRVAGGARVVATVALVGHVLLLSMVEGES